MRQVITLGSPLQLRKGDRTSASFLADRLEHLFDPEFRAMAEHGHVEIGYRDELTTRMPTPDETQTLDLAAGVPMLAYVRTCYTKERPVRLTETIFAGDRNRLVHELGDLEALYERDQ